MVYADCQQFGIAEQLKKANLEAKNQMPSLLLKTLVNFMSTRLKQVIYKHGGRTKYWPNHFYYLCGLILLFSQNFIYCTFFQLLSRLFHNFNYQFTLCTLYLINKARLKI